jgi:hypothetical protein
MPTAWHTRSILFKPSFVLIAAPLWLPTALTARNLWIVGPCDGVVHILFTTMVLRDTHCQWVGLLQPFIVGIRNTPANRQEGHTLIGGNVSCDYRFLFWKYPGQGLPFNELAGAPELPEGQSVSIAP